MFLKLRDKHDLDRLDERLIADVGLVRTHHSDFRTSYDHVEGDPRARPQAKPPRRFDRRA
jgi:hypothetical protein